MSVLGKSYFGHSGGVGVFDFTVPGEIKVYKHSELPPNMMIRYDIKDQLLVDYVTKKEEPIPGLKPVVRNVQNDQTRSQRPYEIYGYAKEGFMIYDLSTRKLITDKPVFAGWMKFDQAVYFKKLNKLLVISELPRYTWPNATKEDPGASAYTLDMSTGEITPYLLTDDRAEYVKMAAQVDKEFYAYQALPECERANRRAKFKPGSFAVSTIDNSKYPPSIVLGYDCEHKSYVVARRQLLNPGSNDIAQMSRLHEVQEADMDQHYSATDAGWKICHACSGFPAGYVTENYSGWSEWEQKSLNIYLYTRKWETKSVKMQVLCKVCKGEAWVK
jgi:hypothetical protein